MVYVITITMKRFAFVLAVFLFVWGCDKPETAVLSKSSKSIEEASTETIFQPFYIYSDKDSFRNHYIPSGFMPNGRCITFNDGWKENCYSGETCVKVVYDLTCSAADQRWAGIYWLNPANNWGQQKGGFDLTGATKLTFWARGQEGGEKISEFTVGGITGNYPDSTKAMLGPVILTPEWKEYTIDLRGKDLSYISGGLAWTANMECHESAMCVFYLDDMRFEQLNPDFAIQNPP